MILKKRCLLKYLQRSKFFMVIKVYISFFKDQSFSQIFKKFIKVYFAGVM